MPCDDRPAPHAEEVSDKGALPIGEGRFFLRSEPIRSIVLPGRRRLPAPCLGASGKAGFFLLLQFTVFRELIDDHGDDDQ